jgi:predicted  nucleic acid-binding Zn-ribbon protein
LLEVDTEGLKKERDELLAKVLALTQSNETLQNKLEISEIKRQEALDTADQYLTELQEKLKWLKELSTELEDMKRNRDELLKKLEEAEKRIAELEIISHDRDKLLLEMEDLRRQLEQALQGKALAEQKVLDLTQSIQDMEGIIAKLSAELTAARKNNEEIRAFFEERCGEWEACLAKNKEELDRLMAELMEARRQQDEMKALLDASVKRCQELEDELYRLRNGASSDQEALLQSREEIERLRAEIERLKAELDQAISEKAEIQAAWNTKWQVLLQWTKKQRSGLGIRFDYALDAWMKARMFDGWRRIALSSRFNKVVNELKQRMQAAVDSATLDGRRAGRYQEEADQLRAECERLRREIRELMARLAEIERLKEVDVKLEIMTRERKLRQMLDQRPDSLPLMPESPHGMMPSPPSGDPIPGSSRSLPRGASAERVERNGQIPPREWERSPLPQQERSVSQCARLPPTSHYGRAADQVRTHPSAGVPIRPQTSMDAGVPIRAQTSMDARTSEWSHSPDGRPAPRPASHTPYTPYPPNVPHSARQTPRGQRSHRRTHGRSVPSRKHVSVDYLGGNAASDMWAFVNFGSPLTDDVINAEVPLPKPMRRLVGRDGQAEN